jgi:hypothetical protein
MDKKAIFMVILYTVLLIMMYTFAGILIYKGDAMNKSLYYAFYGFSILISLLCILSLVKSDSKSKFIRFGMGISTIIMFALLLVSVILSKAKVDKSFEIISYVNMALVFLANIYATALVISPPPVQPIFDTQSVA